MPAAILLLTALAAAGEPPRISASVSVEDSWNDVFVHTPQFAAGAAFWARDWASIELHGSWGPRSADATLRPLMINLQEQMVEPDVADIRGILTAEVHLQPLSAQVGPLESTLGVFLGAGVLRSQMPAWLENWYDEDPDELSPVLRYGAEGGLWRDDLGLRLQLAQTRYTEESAGLELHRDHLWVGVGLQWRR